MGGAVSSGESNDELVDNLRNAEYIKSPLVEKVFRAVDRGFYFTKEYRHNAYKDLAWKDGNLHISAPCIYSEVMENLDVHPGATFLHIGSGTGYFSTVVGLILGRNGMNHGIEVHADVVHYARAKLDAFLKSSAAVDIFDFCAPEFVIGNVCDAMQSQPQRYDRIYCGAACSKDDVQLIVNFLKIGGVCILPMNDSLVQVTRVSELKVETKTLLPVSFASLMPSEQSSKNSVFLPSWNPRKLKDICRAEIREILRRNIPPSIRNPEGRQSAGETRKRRRKKRNDGRHANRLLLVQRRRRIENEGRADLIGERDALMALAYAMGGHSTSEDDSESSPSPSHRRKPCHSHSCAETDENASLGEAKEQVQCETPPAQGPSVLPQSNMVQQSGESGEEPIVLESESADEPPQGRRARTEGILERIREMIHHRQTAGRDRPAGPSLTEESDKTDRDQDVDWSSSSSSTSSSDSEEAEYLGIVPSPPPPNHREVEIVNFGGSQVALVSGRPRLISMDSSTEESMDLELGSNELNNEKTRDRDGRSNISVELEELESENRGPLQHPISTRLAQRINQLLLPPAIKKFLNYERQICQEHLPECKA